MTGKSKTEPAEKVEEQKMPEEQTVTSVTEAIPKPPADEQSPEPKPAAKPEDSLVVLSELPTKNIKHSPVNFVDNDAKVFEWYHTRSGLQYYTLEEAAKDLDIPVEELENSLIRLTKTVLPATLDHITDYPEDT